MKDQKTEKKIEETQYTKEVELTPCNHNFVETRVTEVVCTKCGVGYFKGREEDLLSLLLKK